MLDCPVCPRTQIAGESCPQCGVDLKPLLRLAELRIKSQQPPPPPQTMQKWKLPVAAMAMLAVGLVIVPTWRRVHPPPDPVVVNPPTPPQAAQPAEKLYTVQKGESFWSIAKEKYGLGEIWKTIRDDNKDRLRRPGRLSAGEVIRLRTVTLSPK